MTFSFPRLVQTREDDPSCSIRARGQVNVLWVFTSWSWTRLGCSCRFSLVHRPRVASEGGRGSFGIVGTAGSPASLVAGDAVVFADAVGVAEGEAAVCVGSVAGAFVAATACAVATAVDGPCFGRIVEVHVASLASETLLETSELPQKLPESRALAESMDAVATGTGLHRQTVG